MSDGDSWSGIARPLWPQRVIPSLALGAFWRRGSVGL